jgi:hypothetical protein
MLMGGRLFTSIGVPGASHLAARCGAGWNQSCMSTSVSWLKENVHELKFQELHLTITTYTVAAWWLR